MSESHPPTVKNLLVPPAHLWPPVDSPDLIFSPLFPPSKVNPPLQLNNNFQVITQ